MTVSPTWVSFTFLMLAVKYPTSPACKASVGSLPMGLRYPHSSTVYSAPVAISRMVCPLRSVPSLMRKYTTTPT